MASMKDKGWFCSVTRQYVNPKGAKVCAALNRLFISEATKVAKAMPKRYYHSVNL